MQQKKSSQEPGCPPRTGLVYPRNCIFHQPSFLLKLFCFVCHKSWYPTSTDVDTYAHMQRPKEAAGCHPLPLGLLQQNPSILMILPPMVLGLWAESLAHGSRGLELRYFSLGSKCSYLVSHLPSYLLVIGLVIFLETKSDYVA